MDARQLEERTQLFIRRFDETPKPFAPIEDPGSLGALLLKHQLIREETLRKALLLAQKEHLTLDQTLVKHGNCSEEQLARALGKVLNLKVVDPRKADPDPEYLIRVPAGYAKKNACLPLRIEQDFLLVAVADPTDAEIATDLSVLTGEKVRLAVAPRSMLTEAIERAYAAPDTGIVEVQEIRKELQEKVEEAKQANIKAWSFSIVSNKGGVGKTHTAINLAYLFAQMGYRTLIIDTDLGNADISNKLRLYSPNTLAEFLDKKLPIEQTVMETPFGFHLIPGKTGEMKLANMKYFQRLRFMKGFAEVGASYNIIIYDLGAGVNLQVLDFALCADEVLIVTTPRDLVAGYACAKLLFFRHIELEKRMARQSPNATMRKQFQPVFLFNQVENPQEAQAAFQTVSQASQQCVRSDAEIAQSGFTRQPAIAGAVLRAQENYVAAEHSHVPFCKSHPTHPNVQLYQGIVRNLLNRVVIRPSPNENFGRVVKVVSGGESGE